ncbi:MAG: class I SAM-dependent methyltransferase [Steroidobacteraceae bacterium]|nr:class I SAM-dependent methyltransferase [Nevskiaceae bacterium]MCP5467286.1 class I SAM-dependent methyltransferase [Nevskiaceae bacterium]MCP5471139.1 class I SAM-dependent methyltransferase [Nevskiaceae bacterium]
MQPREFAAGQEFLVAAKRYWSTTLYRNLRARFDELAASDPSASTIAAEASPPPNLPELAAALEQDVAYRHFAWLERHLQKLKYSGPYGLVPYYEERRQALLQRLDVPPRHAGLSLDPALALPGYYTRVDIHQHPGGVWSDDLAGFVYQAGAQTTTPLLGESHATLHDRFTGLIAQRGDSRHILDLGCGFGKSTHPFANTFRAANIDAIDLSAACLRLAAADASGPPAARIHFRQMDAGRLGFAEASFDLVTSTMLLHEIPPPPLRQVLEESFRVLQPGGRAVHLDFYHMPDVFQRLLHYGHARRNNEPYMQPLAELDLPAMLRAIGFVDILIEPFREADDATDDAWRFPWTVISARKPAV